MKRIALIALVACSCTIAPPPNPIPVTRANSPVEIFYRRPTQITITGPRDSTLRFEGVTLVSGRLIERRGDSALVAVALVDDVADEVVQIPEGFVLRVEHGDSVVLRRPFAGQQVAELGFLALMLGLLAGAVYLFSAIKD